MSHIAVEDSSGAVVGKLALVSPHQRSLRHFKIPELYHAISGSPSAAGWNLGTSGTGRQSHLALPPCDF